MKRILCSAMFACLALIAARGDAAVVFELVSAQPPTEQNVASGVVVTNYTRGTGVGVNAGSTFNSNGFASGDFATALGAEDFITWGFTSATPYDLSDFSIRYDRSGTGPTALQIDFSANGGAFTTVLSDADVDAAGEDNLLVSMSSFTNVTSGTFRLTAWSGASTGTFDFENTAAISASPATASFQLQGTAVPEPSSIAVLLVVGGGAVATRYRRRRSSKVALAV